VVLVSDQSTGIKGTKAEGIIVKHPSGLRIGCEQDLKATIKQESFNLVRSNPPPDSVRCFQYLRRNSTLMEPKSTTEACQPSSDDENICIGAHFLSPLFREMNLLGLLKWNKRCKNNI
jgi:hypothetical protein